MRVNHEQFMAKLLVHVASKPNHGKRELLDTIITLQAEAMVEDDSYHEFLSRFGEEVADAVLGLLPAYAGLQSDSPGDELAGPTHEGVPPSAIAHNGHGGTSWKPPHTRHLPEHLLNQPTGR